MKWLAIALLAAACGTGAEVHGAVKGHSFEAKDAQVHILRDGENSLAELWIGSRDNLCGWLSGNLLINYTDLLVVRLAIAAPTGEVVAPDVPGRYDIVPDFSSHAPKIALGGYLNVDCKLSVNLGASGGSVTITDLDRSGDEITSMSGGFELDFGADGAFSGEFHAGRCGYVAPVYMQGNVCSPTH